MTASGKTVVSGQECNECWMPCWVLFTRTGMTLNCGLCFSSVPICHDNRNWGHFHLPATFCSHLYHHIYNENSCMICTSCVTYGRMSCWFNPIRLFSPLHISLLKNPCTGVLVYRAEKGKIQQRKYTGLIPAVLYWISSKKGKIQVPQFPTGLLY